MATLLLSAIGAVFGGGIGGGVLGVGSAAIGRAVGATIGRAIDQRLLGGGSEPVEMGRVERFRLMGASEGTALPRVWGRFRLGGQVIWATEFREERARRRIKGGKGSAKSATVTSFSYSVTMALALCEGPILRVGRVWADGNEISPETIVMRVYSGEEDQLPDPRIEAVEGPGMAPAYRGLAYVVIEDLELGRFGNRVPQLSFEVVRSAMQDTEPAALAGAIRAVALVPGTGEYALATSKVRITAGPGRSQLTNVHTPSGKSDLSTAVDQLAGELPKVEACSVIVSWFGGDLRCGECEIQPKVEQADSDAVKMPWQAGGLLRRDATLIARQDGRAIYGGTPTDQSVVEAIQALRDSGKSAMFYPFVLMEQTFGNGLPDPWTGAADQPVLPWRGRITLSVAPGRAGSPDGTPMAVAQVRAFFGDAEPWNFQTGAGRLEYSGPSDWGYRRFILHYAHLCAMAGGVEAFCIGSELRGLTQIRGPDHSFPAVEQLRRLAADVRGILGPDTRISYAADWSEYFGYHADGNVYFHLDPLWSDPAINFIGIDNYMPLSDWREGEDHADASWGTIYDLDYLKANVAGGEGYDWYYDSEEGEAAQRRLPISDSGYAEDWVFRPKDLKSWWSKAHHNRIGGVRLEQPTVWQPQSKPIWFTEYGCAAINKGTNQPNRFVDPKSSESALPRASNGGRDDFVQMQYYRAMSAFWQAPANNPVSPIYGSEMVNMARAFAWAWDVRPFPAFPTRSDIWSDGGNYRAGHWLNGRASSQVLADVIASVCAEAGVAVEAAGAAGTVRGFAVTDVATSRSILQSLGLAFGFDAIEQDGTLSFRSRRGDGPVVLNQDDLVVLDELRAELEWTRRSDAEDAGKVRLGFVEDQSGYEVAIAESALPDNANGTFSQVDLALVLGSGEARAIATRWLAETRIAQESIRFGLPPSGMMLRVGDTVALGTDRFRVDRIERAGAAIVEALRIEAEVYNQNDLEDNFRPLLRYVPPSPVLPVFMDLPLLTGEEVPHAPHVAVAASPWPGPVAIWESATEDGFALNTLVQEASVIGITENDLAPAAIGLVDRGPALRVRLVEGVLSSTSWDDVLNGANLAAIGDGSGERWEVFQFTEAALSGPDTFDLTLRLRGQFGTDITGAQTWPAGSTFVLLDGGPSQIQLPVALRAIARNYRIGRASEGAAGEDVEERRLAFQGIGLRPYSVVHLRETALAGGDRRFSWLRRTRVDGDSWQSLEVPLGEESERYILRVLTGDQVLREVETSLPAWVYPQSLRSLDQTAGSLSLDVAQLSLQFGPGPFRRIVLAA